MLILEAEIMDSFEWEVFKRTGTIEDYLQMKQREREYQNYLAEMGADIDFWD